MLSGISVLWNIETFPFQLCFCRVEGAQGRLQP